MTGKAKTGTATGGKDGRTKVQARRGARLAAVQALYQIHLSGATPEAVLGDFGPHRLAQDQEGIDLADADPVLLRELVEGVVAEETALDDMLTAVLAEDWPVERLEILLRVILRAGAFELAYKEDIPPRVTIKEYVNLAQAFFDGREPGLANGVLDSLARHLRPDELEHLDTSPPRPGGG